MLVEAERCGHGPSGRNGGFVHGYWSMLGWARAVLGDARALELARAGDGILPAVRALGEDVWLREAGMLEVATTPRQEQRGRRRGRHGARARRAGGGCAALARGSRSALSLTAVRERRPVPGVRHGAARATGARPAPTRARRGCRGVRAHARDARARRRRRDAERHDPRGRDRARDELGARAVAPDRETPRRVPLLRRPDRAGARPDRRAGLDRRRGDRRRPHVPPLLPHDERRPRADGERRRDAAPRRARSAAPPPRARGGADHAPLGRPDRRLGRPPPERRLARPHPLRRRLHRQRRRPDVARRAVTRVARAASRRRVVAAAARRPARPAAAAVQERRRPARQLGDPAASRRPTRKAAAPRRSHDSGRRCRDSPGRGSAFASR